MSQHRLEQWIFLLSALADTPSKQASSKTASTSRISVSGPSDFRAPCCRVFGLILRPVAGFSSFTMSPSDSKTFRNLRPFSHTPRLHHDSWHLSQLQVFSTMADTLISKWHERNCVSQPSRSLDRCRCSLHAVEWVGVI